jgi:hypothetical protein
MFSTLFMLSYRPKKIATANLPLTAVLENTAQLEELAFAAPKENILNAVTVAVRAAV